MSQLLTWQQSNNTTNLPPPAGSTSFSITAPPKTDIWRPDTQTDTFTAPYIYTTLPTAKNFKSLSVTFSAKWKTLYDQGGLMLQWPNQKPNTDASTATSSSSSLPASGKWVKAGIEFFNSKPNLGIVGCDRFSDWSLAPIPQGVSGEGPVRFVAERVGTTLWIYVLVGANGEVREALREIKWAFLEESESAELRVGIYAAKPTADEGDEKAGVEVKFQDIKLETE